MRQRDDLSSDLADRLRLRIEREGAITFREWMHTALYDDQGGYYCRPDRIRQGRAGDYRTAPETSELFAATFARYFAALFDEMDSPERLTILEVGAGAGDFAYGLLGALRIDFPAVYNATHYLIDEISSANRAKAADRLATFGKRASFQSLTELRGELDPALVFSNELIDAFPVHRVAMRNGALRELCVDVESERFVWVECEPDARLKEYCERAQIKLAEGQTAEINLEAEDFLARAASLIRNGFLITVDYGAERNELFDFTERPEGTLRGFYRHQLIDDVLSSPGATDLTTTINWTQIKQAGERAGLVTIRHERLDQFLMAEGLLDQLESTVKELPAAERVRLRTGAREMIMPGGMAAAFQVLVQKKQLRSALPA